jgi:hypothetical protein
LPESVARLCHLWQVWWRQRMKIGTFMDWIVLYFVWLHK